MAGVGKKNSVTLSVPGLGAGSTAAKLAHLVHPNMDVLCDLICLYLGLEQDPQPQSRITWSIPTWDMYSVTLSVSTWAWSRVHSRKVGPLDPLPHLPRVFCRSDLLCGTLLYPALINNLSKKFNNSAKHS